jgi:hypothetical protein
MQKQLTLFPGTPHCYCTRHKRENQNEEPACLV